MMIGAFLATLLHILQIMWQILRDPAMNTLLVLISVILASLALLRKPKQEISSPEPNKSFMNGEHKLGVIEEAIIVTSSQQLPRKKPQKHQPTRCKQRKSKLTALTKQRGAGKRR